MSNDVANPAQPPGRKSLSHIFGLDRHIAYTLIFRLWSVVGGLGNLVMVPLFLTATEQGYYYTYGSLIALQVFFELGLNQVLTQFVSHEIAHLDLTDANGLALSPHYKRIGSLIRLMGRWYTWMAIGFMVLVGAGGAFFFTRSGTIPIHTWLPAWLFLVAASSVNLWLSPWLAFLEGCGRVGDVAKMRFAISITGYIAMWIALSLKAGLNATPLVPAVSAIYAWHWLRKNGNFIQAARNTPCAEEEEIKWRVEILPLQWRISLSWISSYLIFNLFTPVAFQKFGAVAAGRLGMSLSVFSSITNIGMSWVNARSPTLSMYAARKDFHSMKSVFWRATLRSVGAIVVGALLFCIAAAVLKAEIPRIGLRLTSLEIMVYLSVIAVANCVIFSAATYMRAFKKEPMLAVSLTTGLLSGAAIYFGADYGLVTMMQLYAVVVVFVCLPWTLSIFRIFYKNAKISE